MGDLTTQQRYQIRDPGILVDICFTFVVHIEQRTAKARQSMRYIKVISKRQFGVKTLKLR